MKPLGHQLLWLSQIPFNWKKRLYNEIFNRRRKAHATEKKILNDFILKKYRVRVLEYVKTKRSKPKPVNCMSVSLMVMDPQEVLRQIMSRTFWFLEKRYILRGFSLKEKKKDSIYHVKPKEGTITKVKKPQNRDTSLSTTTEVISFLPKARKAVR